MNNCQDNLINCNAECCRTFVLINHAILIKPKITFFKICTADMRRYYKYHGCSYNHGFISFTYEGHKQDGNKFIFTKKCQGLDWNNQCMYHGTEKQPIICKTPNSENHTDLPNVFITPNCKYHKH
jgi:hypothetical protein